MNAVDTSSCGFTVYSVDDSCSSVTSLNTVLEMPIEVRPKAKHRGMMKKARGSDRFDTLDSESLMPPALRYAFYRTYKFSVNGAAVCFLLQAQISHFFDRI